MRTETAITAADLERRLFALAHDSMMGRMPGTEGNAKASAWVASEFRRVGLQPYLALQPFAEQALSRPGQEGPAQAFADCECEPGERQAGQQEYAEAAEAQAPDPPGAAPCGR